MTLRRHFWCVVAGLLAAAPAAGQEAAERGTEAAPAAAPARKPRQNRRRAARPRNGPAEGSQQHAAPAPEPVPRAEAAPVPNRDLEAPRAPGASGERARLSPSVIHRPLPGQGMAAEGAQNIQEERLFFPAPGARINVPFSY